MKHKTLALGIVLLFIVSSINSLGMKIQNNDKIQDDLMEVMIPIPEPLDGPMNSSWPMFKHDARHTGRSTVDTSHNLGGESWKYEVKGGTHSSASIDKNGTIYFTEYGEIFNGLLTALYPNGTLKWSFHIGDWSDSSPAIAEDGTIYVTTQHDDKLIAVNPDGTEKWVFPLEGFSCEPTIEKDGTIYVGTQIGELYAIFPNGTMKWKYETGNGLIVRSPAIGNDGIVYITSCDSNLYALYPNGTLKWTFESPGMFYSSPVVGDDGTIYIAPLNEFLFAVNPDGIEKWRASARGGCHRSPSLGPDGTIYLAGTAVFLNAFNPDGSRKWAIEFTSGDNGEVIYSRPSVGADGTIYIGCEERLFAINPDGTEKWTTKLTTDIQPYDGCSVHSSPTIAEDGTIYIGTWFRREGQGFTSWGYLHAIGSEDQKKVRITKPESGYVYVNNKKRIRTFLGSTIVFGDLNITFEPTFEEEIKRITFILKFYDPLLPYRQRFEIPKIIECGIDVEPPYFFNVDIPDSEFIFHFYMMQVIVEYHGGSTTSDKMNIFFIRRPTSLETPVTPSINWKFDYGRPIVTSPTLSDGRIFFGNCDNMLFCIDANTGNELWHYITDAGVETTPAVVNGTVYFGSNDHNMYCINASTGGLIWSYTTGYWIQSSPAVCNGRVYFGSDDNNVYCLNADNGSLIWMFPTGDDVSVSPIVDNGYLYVGSKDHSFYCLNADSGNLVWRYLTDHRIRYITPVIHGDKVIFSSEDRFVYCLNKYDGEQIWSFETGFLPSSPTVYDDKVFFSALSYFGEIDNKLYCLDVDTCRMLWSYKLVSDWHTLSSDPPVVENGRIYGCYADDYTYCNSVDNGELLWRFEAESFVRHTPIIVNDIVYVTSWDGHVYSLTEPPDI